MYLVVLISTLEGIYEQSVWFITWHSSYLDHKHFICFRWCARRHKAKFANFQPKFIFTKILLFLYNIVWKLKCNFLRSLDFKRKYISFIQKRIAYGQMPTKKLRSCVKYLSVRAVSFLFAYPVMRFWTVNWAVCAVWFFIIFLNTRCLWNIYLSLNGITKTKTSSFLDQNVFWQEIFR